MKYIDNAPPELVTMYETGEVHSGRRYLRRLVISSPGKNDLSRAWRTLNACNLDAKRLWAEITLGIYLAKKRQPTRAEKRDSYLALVRDVLDIKQRIENTVLDRELWYFFDAEDMVANNVRDWDSLSDDERRRHAYRLMRHWPAMSWMLESLAAAAKQNASKAMDEERLKERHDYHPPGKVDHSVFIRYFHNYLNQTTGKNYPAPVAHITNALFDTDFSNRSVEAMCRRIT